MDLSGSGEKTQFWIYMATSHQELFDQPCKSREIDQHTTVLMSDLTYI